MMERLDRWVAGRLSNTLGAAQIFLAAMAILLAGEFVATWSANIATTWVQTLVERADTHDADKSSISRWAETRGQWAVRLDRLEQACARR